jgi:hypothetical protein
LHATGHVCVLPSGWQGWLVRAEHAPESHFRVALQEGWELPRARARKHARARASTRTRTPLHQLHRSTVHGQARPPHRVRRSVRRMRSHPALVALYAFRTCRAQSRVCRCSPLRRSQGWTISCADWRRWRPTVAPMEALQGRARPRAPHPAAAPNSRRAKPGVRLGEYSSAAYRPPSTLETHSPIQKKPARI